MKISCFKKYLLLFLLSSCFLPNENTITVEVYNKTYERITIQPTQNIDGFTKINADEIVPILVDKDEKIEVVGDDSGNIKSRIFTESNVTWTVTW